MTTQGNAFLHNPQLDGDAFFWPGGPTGILLAHGYTATTAEIRPLAEKLHQRGYTLAAPLLPGHGTQPDDLNRTRWQEWAQAGQETLEKLFTTCEQVFVGGQSMGGLLALYLASQNPKVVGLLLYAPAILLTMSAADRLKLHLGAPFLSQVSRASLDCSDTWQGYPGLPLKGALQLLRFRDATEARLTKINQPTLIFQGRLDTTVAAEAGDFLIRKISSPVKKRFWMEHSHHTITLDVECEQAAALTSEFIEQTLASFQ